MPPSAMDLASRLVVGTSLSVTAYFWFWRSRAEKDADTPLSGINFRSMLQLLGYSLKIRKRFVLAWLAMAYATKKMNPKSRIVLGMFLYYLYYAKKVAETPVVITQKTLFNRRLIRGARLLRSYFPCVYMSNAHAMTALGMLASELEFMMDLSKVELRSTRLPSYDGVNEIHFDWYVSSNEASSNALLGRLNNQGTSKSAMPAGARPTVTGGDEQAKGVPKGEAGASGVEKHAIAAAAADCGSGGEDSADDSVVCILVHGLGGSSDEAYLKNFATLCHSKGWRACSYDYWRLDYGEWRDLDICVKHVHRCFPRAPIVLAGFSAGTHVLFRYLQAVGKKTPVVAAVAVSCVLDLVGEYQNVIRPRADRERAGQERGVARAYKAFADTSIHRMVARHLLYDKRPDTDRARMEAALLDPELKDCDKLYDMCISSTSHSTHPLQNDAGAVGVAKEAKGAEGETGKEAGRAPSTAVYDPGNAAHYRGVAKSKMHMVGVTTLLIHAMDDPIVSAASIDWRDIRRNKNLISVITQSGGHVAWKRALLPFGVSWADHLAVDFLASAVELHAHSNFVLDIVRFEADRRAHHGTHARDQGDREEAEEEPLMLTHQTPPATPHFGAVGPNAVKGKAERVAKRNQGQISRISSISDLLFL